MTSQQPKIVDILRAHVARYNALNIADLSDEEVASMHRDIVGACCRAAKLGLDHVSYDPRSWQRALKGNTTAPSVNARTTKLLEDEGLTVKVVEPNYGIMGCYNYYPDHCIYEVSWKR